MSRWVVFWAAVGVRATSGPPPLRRPAGRRSWWASHTIRTLITDAHELTPDDDPIVLATTVDHLATTIAGLDHWLSTGGFLPQPWTAGCPTAVAR